MPSASRVESNCWLRDHCKNITGDVLSIGSGNDKDGEGKTYREYFRSARSYMTSECDASFGCDMVIDVMNMDGIEDESYHCVFCSGVLEHVPDYISAICELHRVLKPNGILLLGTPFNQPIHFVHDYWRFTRDGVAIILGHMFRINCIDPIIGNGTPQFPTAYWTEGVKLQ